MVAKSDSTCFGNNKSGSGNNGSCTKDATDMPRMVPSLKEKNQAIADAYDAGRRLLVPRLIDVLFSIPLVDQEETEVDAMGGHEVVSPSSSSSSSSTSSPWVCSSHLFNSRTLAGTGVAGMTVPKFSTRIWQTGGTTHADWVVRCDVTRDGNPTTGPSSTWPSPTEVYFGGDNSSCSGDQSAPPVTVRNSKKQRDKGRRHDGDYHEGMHAAAAAAEAAVTPPSLVASDIPSQSHSFGTDGSESPTCGSGQTTNGENATMTMTTTIAPPPPPPLPVQLGKKKKGKKKNESNDVETSGMVVSSEAASTDRPSDSSQPVELPSHNTGRPGKKKDKARRQSRDVETPSSSSSSAEVAVAALESVESLEITTNQLVNEQSKDLLCGNIRQNLANEVTPITVQSRKKKDNSKSKSNKRQSKDMESSLATTSTLDGPEVSSSHPSENQRLDHVGTSHPLTDMEPSESTATSGGGDGTETPTHQPVNEGTENLSDGTSQPVEETPPIQLRVAKKKGKTRRHSTDVETPVKPPDLVASEATGDQSEQSNRLALDPPSITAKPGKKKSKKTRTSLIVEGAKQEVAAPHHPEDKRSTDSSCMDAPELPLPVVEESVTTTTTKTTNRYLLRHKFSDGFYYYRACQVAAFLDGHPHSKHQEQEQDQQRDDVEIKPKWIHSMTQNAVDEYISSPSANRLQSASSATDAIPASLTHDMNQLLGEVLAGVAAAEALKIGFVPRITTIKWKEQLVTYRYI